MAIPPGEARWKITVAEGTSPLLKEFLEFLPEIVNESDRGMVLATTSYLDGQLSRLIREFCVSDKAAEFLVGDHGYLGTTEARIATAFALGLIDDEERRDLVRISEIRDLFAHLVSAGFSLQSIMDKCRTLKLGAKRGGRDDAPLSEHFTRTVIALAFRLSWRRQHANAARRPVPSPGPKE